MPEISQLGARALPVFLALLAALLGLSAAGWWLLPRLRGRLPAAATPVLVGGLLGFGLVLGAATLFVEIAGQLDPQGRMAAADDALTASIRLHLDPGTLAVFALLTRFGDTATLSLLGVLVAGLLAGQRCWALALGWVLAVGGNALLNPLLKQIFERVRPIHTHGLVSETGWSFPSGHSSGATVAYGMLAYLALRLLPPRWHLPAVLAAAALAFSVGASRVFLQVHFASDVIAGFCSGLAWLTVSIASVELARHWRQAR